MSTRGEQLNEREVPNSRLWAIEVFFGFCNLGVSFHSSLLAASLLIGRH